MQKHIAKLRNKNPQWQKLGAQSVQEISERLDTSYKRFFKKIAKRPPKFKKRYDFSSICYKQAGFKLENNKLTISKIGNFKFNKSREYENIKRISIKRDSIGDFYLILCCDIQPNKLNRTGNAAVGIDFGLKTFLTLSDTNSIESPLFYKQFTNKIKKKNQELSSKTKGSKNRTKAKVNLAKVYQKMVNKREDHQWKLAHELCSKHSFIALEDLNIAGMKALWGRKVSDLSFSSFVLKLQQVANKYGTVIQKIDRFYPSSKLCSCGVKNTTLQLRDRTWTCQACNAAHDRDLLAANNIKTEGIRLYQSTCKTNLISFVQ
jgi:putative transposase